MAEEPDRIWEELLLELQDRIMSLLEPNEVAGTVRLVCKAAAARYPGPRHTRIRLSQRVPAHAFARRWGQPEAMRSLSYEERKQLLCLTAASGSIPNLQLLLPLVSCTLDMDVCAAAAAAGHLATCQWLRQQRCPWSDKAMEAAGRSGSRALCDWLIAAGCPGGADAALAGAASAGHVGLVDQLLASYGPPARLEHLLVAAASGYHLPALRRLNATFAKDEGWQSEQAGERVRIGYALTEAAAGSPTPDWREKLEWLEAQGCPRTARASDVGASRCPDALDRLTWLAGRGWPMHLEYVATLAAELGNVDALQFALEARGRQGGPEQAGPDAEAAVRIMGMSSVHVAAENGQLASLHHLHALGGSMISASRSAASYGHLHVVAWLVKMVGAEAVLSEEVFTAAARSGSLPLLVWLRERGCVCRDASVLVAALDGFMGRGAGSEELLEWLLAQGCCMQLSTSSWVGPSYRGDLAALAWLRRMGCPWAADGSTFTGAVKAACPLPSLRWLAEAGCPVDWEAALEEARPRWQHWRHDPEAEPGLEELRRQHAALP